jgi:hypothetical protein
MIFEEFGGLTGFVREETAGREAGFSAAAAKAPPSVEMTIILSCVERSYREACRGRVYACYTWARIRPPGHLYYLQISRACLLHQEDDRCGALKDRSGGRGGGSGDGDGVRRGSGGAEVVGSDAVAATGAESKGGKEKCEE